VYRLAIVNSERLARRNILLLATVVFISVSSVVRQQEQNTNVSPVNVFRSVTVAITYELVLYIPQVNAQAKYVAQR